MAVRVRVPLAALSKNFFLFKYAQEYFLSFVSMLIIRIGFML